MKNERLPECRDAALIKLRFGPAELRELLESTGMTKNVLSVLFNQSRFALPNGLERLFKLHDSFKVFRKKGDDFIVVDGHKLTHCRLNVLQKLYFYRTLTHLVKKMVSRVGWLTFIPRLHRSTAHERRPRK